MFVLLSLFAKLTKSYLYMPLSIDSIFVTKYGGIGIFIDSQLKTNTESVNIKIIFLIPLNPTELKNHVGRWLLIA